MLWTEYKSLDKILDLLYNYVMFLYTTMTSSSTVTTEDGGRQNVFASEPQVEVIDQVDQLTRAERTNGRWAMIGFVAAVGAYVSTGQIIPGLF